MVLYCSLYLLFLITEENKDLRAMLFTGVSFSVNCPFMSFAHFSIGFEDLFLLICSDSKRQWTNTSITYKELQINKNKSSKPIEK